MASASAHARPRIGVLALQGDFQAHARAIQAAGGDAVEVRTASVLQGVDGLILPGGESTTMLRLLHEENLWEPLAAFGARRPIFGTCAGAILLARQVLSPEQESLALADITVERNAYGRQIDSRIVTVRGEPGSGLEHRTVEAVFIRAPIIRAVGPGVQVLLRYQGDPILVAAGRHLIATFHPELTDDPTIHQKFLERVQGGE